jgi:hypothetical protein
MPPLVSARSVLRSTTVIQFRPNTAVASRQTFKIIVVEHCRSCKYLGVKAAQIEGFFNSMM